MVVMKDWMRDLILGAETSRAREEKSRGVERPGEKKEEKRQGTRADGTIHRDRAHLSSTTLHSTR